MAEQRPFQPGTIAIMLMAPMAGLAIFSFLIFFCVLPFVEPQYAGDKWSFGGALAAWLLVAIFGSWTALKMAFLAICLLGAPLYWVQYRLKLTGPISFALVGLLLGVFTRFVWYGEINPFDVWTVEGSFTQQLTVGSAVCGWLYFWFMRRPSKDFDALRET